MPKVPQVSVVMPVYNREDLVGRAIQSILGQEFGDFEFIIVDDGSTDGTVDVIRSFGDPRIRLTSLPVNCGVPMARNFGFRLARGEVIATMDSDDVALPARLGKQRVYLAANPEIDILGTHAIHIDGNERRHARPPTSDAEIKARFLALDATCMYNPTTMIRVRFLEKTGLLSPITRTDSDHGFWIEAMINRARFANLPEPLLEYHRHGGNITAEPGKALTDHLRRKTPMRARLLGLFFPGLTHDEALAIATWMEEGRSASVMEVCMALAAMAKASMDARSYLGESKAELGKILGEHARRALTALQSLARQGQGA